MHPLPFKVFLGGTCNGSTWRDELIKYLDVDYFNPVVDDWTEQSQQEERFQREHCDALLYVITPKLEGVFSIAEAVESSIINPHKTVFAYVRHDDGAFSTNQTKSLKAVADLTASYGVIVFEDVTNLTYLAYCVNERAKRRRYT